MQGEGACAGLRTMFIRFGYCDARCAWCDSMYAVDVKNKPSWKQMTTTEILEELSPKAGGCFTVTISGGNPLIHDLTPLVRALRNWGWNIWVETQGTIYRDWLKYCNVTISPKPPSAYDYDIPRLRKFLKARERSLTSAPIGVRTVMKIPIDPLSEDDRAFAVRTFGEECAGMERYLSVVTYPNDSSYVLLNRWRLAADWVMANKHLPDVHVLAQLHVLIYGHGRGV